MTTEIAYRLHKPRLRRKSRRLNAERRPNLPEPIGSAELISGLRELGTSRVTDNEWQSFVAAISEDLSEGDLRSFLREPNISRTLHPNQFLVSWRYLRYLQRKELWHTTLSSSCIEQPFGDPWIDPSRLQASPLLIQHCYHLCVFLEHAGLSLGDVGAVFELGGGYGLVARLLKQLGWKGAHLIYDLPHVVLLQRFYLKNVFRAHLATDPGLVDDIDWVSGPPGSPEVVTVVDAWRQGVPSVFLATFSLSELPRPDRDAMLPTIRDFDMVWTAFQQSFGDVDNRRWFENHLCGLDSHEWTMFECPAYRNNYYALGKRR